VVHLGPELAYRVQGLAARSRYAFRVVAHNGVGPSAPSDVCEVETQLLPPGAPAEGPRVEAEGPLENERGRYVSSLTVCCAPPEAEDTRAAVLSYEIECSRARGDAESSSSNTGGGGGGKGNSSKAEAAAAAPVVRTSREPQVEVTGLECGQAYSVRFRCVGVDSTGHSAWSRPVLVRTPPAPARARPAAEESAVEGGSRRVPVLDEDADSEAGSTVAFGAAPSGARARREGASKGATHVPKAKAPPKQPKPWPAQVKSWAYRNRKWLYGLLCLISVVGLIWAAVEHHYA
jgi:hypothetical protein